MRPPTLLYSSRQAEGSAAPAAPSGPLRMTWVPLRDASAAPPAHAGGGALPLPPRVRTHFLTQQRTVHGMAPRHAPSSQGLDVAHPECMLAPAPVVRPAHATAKVSVCDDVSGHMMQVWPPAATAAQMF